MIKLVIFDLDGVLIDAKEIHYNALNKALETLAGKEFVISKKEHLSKYDGLNTKAKLDLLTKEKHLPPTLHQSIFTHKQIHTIDLIKQISFDENLYGWIGELSKEYKICVASNSIRDTVKHALVATKLIDFVDFYYSNEDVVNPKPNAEIYLQCMIKAGVSPKETLIVEDSYIGRQGAEQTGATVVGINHPSDLILTNVVLEALRNSKPFQVKWKDPKLNILIPMAGKGSRFEQAGYTFPKPLIEVHGKPMIQVVVENLNIDANYIYIVQKEHYEKYNLKTLLNLITPNCKIVQVDGVTEGAACTALLAKEYIDNRNPLLIANSDQFIEWNSGEFMYSMGDKVDGGILTFTATHPKWSFVKVEENGFVTEVAEKNPISNKATVGIYYYKQGCEFVGSAEQMISKNIRTNNEFYIAPAFNELIQAGGKVKTFNITKMWGLGDPDSLKYFLENYKNDQSFTRNSR